MKLEFERAVPMTRWGKVALALVVLQGVAVALLDPALHLGLAAALVLCLVSGAYVALTCVDRWRQALGSGAFLAVQHALALAIPWLGHGRTAVAPLAAISLTGMVLPTRWVVPPALLHTLNVVAVCSLQMPREAGRLVLYTFAVSVVFVMAFTEAVTREMRMRERLDAANQKIEAQAALAEEVATLAERARIARELHDSLGHALTASLVQLRVASRDFSDKPEAAKAAIEVTTRAVVQGISELRQTVRALHEPMPGIASLEPALRSLANDQRGYLQVHLRVEGEARLLPPHTTLALYRVAQEALTNALKHAGAASVQLTLRYLKGSVELVVHDDGRGFAPDLQPGFGLLGIRQRAEGLGGTLELACDTGARVTARVPLA